MSTTEAKTALAARTDEHALLVGDHRLTALSPGAHGVTLNVVSVSGSEITLTFTGMPGNQPDTYGNTAFLWQNGPSIPYDQPPYDSEPVNSKTTTGSIVFQKVIVGHDYIVGYATGPNVRQTAAWAYIPVSGTSYQYFQTSIWVNPGNVTPNVALVDYRTPEGNNPAAGECWAGIWQGAAASYTQPPLMQGNANASSSGRIPIAGSYARNTQYTVGFFMGAAQNTLAASYSFST